MVKYLGPKYSEKGGGAATGLSNDFIGWLRGGLNSGSFGGMSGPQQTGDAQNNMGGMGGILNDILSGGAGKLGGAYQSMIEKENQRQVDGLRSRFGAEGGMGGGTPAAYGESMLRSEVAPKLASTIGQLQMSAMNPLMQMMAELSGKGITQRQGMMTPNPWMSALSSIAPAAGMALSGPLGGMLGGMFGGGASTTLPNGGPTPFAGFDSSQMMNPAMLSKIFSPGF